MAAARSGRRQLPTDPDRDDGEGEDATMELNAVGDVILTDPRAMRALADGSRLALQDALRRRGTATVGDLAALLDLEPREIVQHLEALEEVGLVECHERGVEKEQTTWAAIGKGIFFEIPEGADGQDAARQLSNTMLLQYVDLPRRWVSDDEPHLTLEWARAAGLLNARILATPEELRDIQAEFERVLEPYLTRQTDDASEDASHVRLLSYFMPEASRRGRS
jgi:DNA-binding transcriptional ArsR family regulator